MHKEVEQQIDLSLKSIKTNNNVEAILSSRDVQKHLVHAIWPVGQRCRPLFWRMRQEPQGCLM